MNTSEAVILIVDDVPTNLEVLTKFLQNTGFKVLIATDGESAIEQAEYALPDMILLDVMMPKLDGFETCRELKSRPATRDIPVIFLTALSDTAAKVRGFELGAADYITKPLHQEEVVARVNAHLTLHRQKQEIERLREQDRQRYEMLSHYKDHMLSTASHDLKNPLAAIMASVGVLRHFVPPEDRRIYERLEHIQEAALSMRDLICNLLDLARLETGAALRKEAVSLQQLLETGIHAAAPEQRAALRVHPPQEEITVLCDVFQIGQVLQNLISNAVKYSPQGHPVELRTEVQPDRVSFHVIDTGIGIPKADIPHLFEKFYRVNTARHQSVSGTGLGLSIVREIVHQHGGDVTVESSEGMGSRFTFFLPR